MTGRDEKTANREGNKRSRGVPATGELAIQFSGSIIGLSSGQKTVLARVADRFLRDCYDPSLNRVIELATGRMKFAPD